MELFFHRPFDFGEIASAIHAIRDQNQGDYRSFGNCFAVGNFSKFLNFFKVLI